jgi:hypothetical protein
MALNNVGEIQIWKYHVELWLCQVKAHKESLRDALHLKCLPNYILKPW